MRTAAIVALALVMSACSSFSPVPVVAGDVCETCKKQIRDVKFAGEVITTQGVVLKFRTPECLATYTRAHPQMIAAKFVTDYNTGRFIRPENATYVRTVLDENTREMTHAAFANFNDAVKFGKDRVASPVDWLMMLNTVANQKAN